MPGPGARRPVLRVHRAEAKIDMRCWLVTLAAVIAREAEQASGWATGHRGDIEAEYRAALATLNFWSSKNSRLIQTQLATYRKLGADPQLWPRSAGSWPGYLFTDAPLSLPAGHFGMGHGTGAHAPDEYYLIESTNPKVQGLDGAVASFVEYLYALS